MICSGVYARSRMTKEEQQKDDENWDRLPEFNHFICERFRTFSRVSAEENQLLIEEYCLPTWSESEWDASATNINRLQQLFSNVSITYNDFHNNGHRDNDGNNFTYGYFSYINPEDGQVKLPPANEYGHGFEFEDFGCKIEFGKFPGILEMVWPSNLVKHRTTMAPLNLQTSKLSTHFGCSFQIGTALINRFKKLKREGVEDISSRIYGRDERSKRDILKLFVKILCSILSFVFLSLE